MFYANGKSSANSVNLQYSLSSFIYVLYDQVYDDFDSKVDNLHSTDDGESSEKSHGATNCW